MLLNRVVRRFVVVRKIAPSLPGKDAEDSTEFLVIWSKAPFHFTARFQNKGMKFFFISFWLLVISVVSSAFQPAYAHYACDVDLNYGVVVNDNQLRVLKKYQTLYQINDQQQLFVAGHWLKLTPAQAGLVQEYAEGLHALVPQVTLLATIGIDLATDTVQQMYESLVGSDHDSYERLNVAIDKIKHRVRKKFRYARANYYIGPSSSNLSDEFEDDDFGLPISTTLTTSAGAILTSLGSMDSDKLAIDKQAMDNINQQLARYALKTGVDGPPAQSTLAQKARWYCDYFARLDAMEAELQMTIPEMAQLNLIDIQSHSEEKATTER